MERERVEQTDNLFEPSVKFKCDSTDQKWYQMTFAHILTENHDHFSCNTFSLDISHFPAKMFCHIKHKKLAIFVCLIK